MSRRKSQHTYSQVATARDVELQRPPAAAAMRQKKDDPPAKKRRKKKNASSKTSITMTPEEMEDEGYGYDYVMVFKVWKEKHKLTEYQEKNNLRDIVRRLNKGGLQTFLFFSTSKDEVFCKIRCPLERLKREADRIDYKLKLDPEQLRAMASEGVLKPGSDPNDEQKEYVVSPISIVDNINASDYDPYDFIFGKYDMEERVQRLYTKYGPRRIPFRSVDRLKLILGIMEARISQGGCNIDVNMHLTKKALEGFFPLHDVLERKSLRSAWVKIFSLPDSQPFDQIKDYFGEKVALYFAWLGHYTTWLFVAAIGGLVASVEMWSTGGNPDVKTMPYFGGVMALWTTLFQEFWKRKQSKLAMEWGVAGYEQDEQDRPQFTGEEITSPIDGEEQLYFDPLLKVQRLFVSIIVILFMTAIVVITVAGIFYFQYWSMKDGRDCKFAVGDRSNDCAEHKQTALGPLFAQGLNSLSIMVMNAIYAKVAVKLNTWENHRTDTEYEDMLTAKVFCFEFINSYGSFFYVAYVKDRIGDPCENDDCLMELSSSVAMIFISQLATGNVDELVIPFVMGLVGKIMGGGDSDGAQVSEAEEQFEHNEYGTQELFDDYAELVLQYGYATLFVCAFPLAPTLALLNNYVEIRVDAFKLLHDMRRPDPWRAEDIGTWFTILEVMATVGVVTNSLIVCFTSKRFTQGWSTRSRVWMFVILEHSILFIRFLFELIVDDVPGDVQMQLQRQEYLVSKLIKLEADDIEDSEEHNDQSKADENDVASNPMLFVHDTWRTIVEKKDPHTSSRMMVI